MSGGSLSLRNCREQTWLAACWQDVNRRVAEKSSFFFSVSMSDKNVRLNQTRLEDVGSFHREEQKLRLS